MREFFVIRVLVSVLLNRNVAQFPNHATSCVVRGCLFTSALDFNLIKWFAYNINLLGKNFSTVHTYLRFAQQLVADSGNEFLIIQEQSISSNTCHLYSLNRLSFDDDANYCAGGSEMRDGTASNVE